MNLLFHTGNVAHFLTICIAISYTIKSFNYGSLRGLLLTLETKGRRQANVQSTLVCVSEGHINTLLSNINLKPPIQWVPGALTPGVKRPDREADHSLKLVPRSRKRGSIHPLPHTPSWRSA
jgi:hypothetical protein